jgi:DNA-binding transcriptional ArsR family regulator
MGNAGSAVHDLIDQHEHIELAARALKAIAHPLRLKILCVVGDHEVCVQDIVDAVGTSQSNISQHLAILRDKSVLQTHKVANRVYYRVADQRTLQLIVMMREVFCGLSAVRN